MHPVKHFKTITNHKLLVMKGCFRIGLYRQGLLHDLSKYAPVEFLVGAKYYQGTMSPNNVERYEKGYSSAWLHHKGRNKHHLEYWIDYDTSKPENGENAMMTGMKMPVNYVCEMFIDRISASRTYLKEAYTEGSPLAYYEHSKDHYMLHADTRALLELLLVMLSVKGEDYAFAFTKKRVLKGKVPYEKATLDRMQEALLKNAAK